MKDKSIIISETTHKYFVEYCIKNGLKVGRLADKILFDFVLKNKRRKKE